ncbi:hypothetical protein KIPB_002200, partial [Kipferlia bialata]|eukprot:g2200.t1
MAIPPIPPTFLSGYPIASRYLEPDSLVTAVQVSYNTVAALTREYGCQFYTLTPHPCEDNVEGEEEEGKPTPRATLQCTTPSLSLSLSPPKKDHVKGVQQPKATLQCTTLNLPFCYSAINGDGDEDKANMLNCV